MPQPPAYNREKDFTENFGSETDHSALNAELDRAGNSINDTRTNLAIIQADDGKLRPSVVTPDSISPELRADLVNQVVVDSQQLLADAQAAAAAATTQANTATDKAAEATAAAATATNKAAEASASAAEAEAAVASINDANLVHKAGDEQIAGLKDFVDYMKIAMMGEKSISEDATGNYAIDFAVKKAANYKLRLTGNVNLSFGSVPTNVAFGVNFRFQQDATGSRTVTWPNTVKWSGGAAPVLTTTPGKADHVSLLTMDGGATWDGFVGGKNY